MAKASRRARPIEEAEAEQETEEKDDDGEEEAAPAPSSVLSEDNRDQSVRESDLMLKRLKELTKGKKDGPVFGRFSDEQLSTPVTERIPTGNLAIDRLIGGGWPVGRISECAAWEGVGKTTLMLQSMAQMQHMGGVVSYIETEKGSDPSYAVRLGVNVDALLTSENQDKESITVEDAFTAIEAYLDVQELRMGELAKKKQQPPPLLIIWDSVGGTPSNAELEGDAEDQHVGTAARAIKRNFRRLGARLARSRTALVFTNQLYQTMGPFATTVSYGGGGIRYHASLRLWLSRKESLRLGSDVVGHVVEAKIKKTRIGMPRPPTDLGLIYGAGVDNAYSLFRWGSKVGDPTKKGHTWITQHGHWYYLMSPEDTTYEPFNRQYIGLGQALMKRPDLYARMATQFLADTTWEE